MSVLAARRRFAAGAGDGLEMSKRREMKMGKKKALVLEHTGLAHSPDVESAPR
jgi:hypothetical protein